jgi:hypothetical protein
MIKARYRSTLFLLAAIGLAKTPPDAPQKSPGGTSTVCDRYRNNDSIFTGSAEGPWIAVFDTGKSPIHKRSEKSKPVRFLVREWYKGQRHDLMDIWMTPSDCPPKIEANQMYLIYARINKSDGKENGRIETNACMGTALATSAAADLTYLNVSLLGPGRATSISGTAGGEGVNVQAKSGIDIRYAISDGAGKFLFEGLQPGDWDLSVVGGSPKSVHLAPDGCVMEDLK